jgi:hypothetical protein
MIKTNEEVMEMAREYCSEMFSPAEFYLCKKAYEAGFQKCQELIEQECDHGFDDWKEYHLNKSFTYEQMWQAAKLSSLKKIEELKTKLAQVEARNEVYREALEYYSDQRNWIGYHSDCTNILNDHLEAFADDGFKIFIGGKRARKALNSGKGE